MLTLEQLNRLRGIKTETPAATKTDSDTPVTTTQTVPPVPDFTPIATPDNKNSPVTPLSATAKYVAPQTLDAGFVITPETQYDEWGMPIITPKAIKEGLAKAREQQNTLQSVPVVTAPPPIPAAPEQEVAPKTDIFGVPQE